MAQIKYAVWRCFGKGDDVSAAVHLRRRDGVVLKRSSKIENY
jgi:hypothetical protein